MLGRKQSLREPVVPNIIATELDETGHEQAEKHWLQKIWSRRFMRFCAFLSLVSVSLNTSWTFSKIPSLFFVTFFIDIFCSIVFTAELIAKLHLKGWNQYSRSRWSQFDALMVCDFCNCFKLY